MPSELRNRAEFAHIKPVVDACVDVLLQLGQVRFCADDEGLGDERFDTPDRLCFRCGRPSQDDAIETVWEALCTVLETELKRAGYEKT